MERTIKSLNIVAAALLIVNLSVEIWDRFRPQKNKQKEKSKFDYSPSFDSEEEDEEDENDDDH